MPNHQALFGPTRDDIVRDAAGERAHVHRLLAKHSSSAERCSSMSASIHEVRVAEWPRFGTGVCRLSRPCHGDGRSRLWCLAQRASVGSPLNDTRLVAEFLRRQTPRFAVVLPCSNTPLQPPTNSSDGTPVVAQSSAAQIMTAMALHRSARPVDLSLLDARGNERRDGIEMCGKCTDRTGLSRPRTGRRAVAHRDALRSANGGR